MINVKNILNGWQNFISKSEVTEQLAKDRAKECSTCKDAVYSKTIDAFINDEIVGVQGYVCNACPSVLKCPLSAKIRSVNEKCPKKLW